MDRVIAAQVYLRICELGSLSAAARALGMSRPMVSRYLEQMENWAGARLIHRSTRRLTLTPAGEKVLLKTRGLTRIADEIAGERQRADPSGTLRESLSQSCPSFTFSTIDSKKMCSQSRFPPAGHHLFTFSNASIQENVMPKHFMRIRDLGHSGAWEIIRRAKEMKETNYRGHCMDGKVAALIFEKASTRTRVSFDVAVRQLGGTTIFMTPAESQLGRSEPLRDTARVLSRYVDCLIVRTFGQEKLDELAEYGSLPVVNALTDQGHPCQLMADLLTIYERTPDFSKVTVTWVGDGNNMANSWIEAAMYFPFQLNMAIAPGYEPDQQLLALALQSGAKIFLTHDPKLAVDGANYIYADVWASMGQEEEQKKREEAFKGFCVDSELMSLAAPGVKFLHCLPAHRGEEVTDEVMESEASIVWDEAENRLHAQKAILEWVFSD